MPRASSSSTRRSLRGGGSIEARGLSRRRGAGAFDDGRRRGEARKRECESEKEGRKLALPHFFFARSLFDPPSTMSSSKPFLLPSHSDEQREHSSAVKRRAYASLVLLVLAASAAMLLFDAAFPLDASLASRRRAMSSPFFSALQPPQPQPPLPKFPSASCMHFVGGGAARPGGAFPQPRQRSPRCWPSIRAYFERGDYLADVAEAVGDA